MRSFNIPMSLVFCFHSRPEHRPVSNFASSLRDIYCTAFCFHSCELAFLLQAFIHDDSCDFKETTVHCCFFYFFVFLPVIILPRHGLKVNLLPCVNFVAEATSFTMWVWLDLLSSSVYLCASVFAKVLLKITSTPNHIKTAL